MECINFDECKNEARFKRFGKNWCKPCAIDCLLDSYEELESCNQCKTTSKTLYKSTQDDKTYCEDCILPNNDFETL